MTTETEQTLPKRTKKPVRQTFSLDYMQDEAIARKHIKNSMEDIRARLKDEGVKTQLKKKRHDDGVQSYAVFYGRKEVVTKKDGSKEKRIVFSDNDYLAIHYDPQRKFQNPRRKK
jgi:hypothetical protein